MAWRFGAPEGIDEPRIWYDMALVGEFGALGTGKSLSKQNSR